MEAAAKASYREFYDDVTRRLERSGMGEASFFLNYGYVSLGDGDEARSEVPAQVFNPSSVRLAFELIGATPLDGRRVLDVGCGRGGTVALLAETLRRRWPPASTSRPRRSRSAGECTAIRSARFEVGDAEHLPFEAERFDAVTNIESSHTYPNLRGVLRRSGARAGGGRNVPLHRPAAGAALDGSADAAAVARLHDGKRPRHHANVLASCDEVAATRTQAFGRQQRGIDNFLAVPGSAVYEQMRSGAWEYRMLRARLSR